MDPLDYGRMSWKVFKDNGLLWLVNRYLHTFGVSIVCQCDDMTDEVIEAYPIRCTYRGFDRNTEDECYKKLTQYLKDNVNELMKDVE